MESLLGVSLSTEGAGGGGSRRGGVSWDSQGSQDYFWRLGSRSEEPRVVRVPPSSAPPGHDSPCRDPGLVGAVDGTTKGLT